MIAAKYIVTEQAVREQPGTDTRMPFYDLMDSVADALKEMGLKATAKVHTLSGHDKRFFASYVMAPPRPPAPPSTGDVVVNGQVAPPPPPIIERSLVMGIGSSTDGVVSPSVWLGFHEASTNAICYQATLSLGKSRQASRSMTFDAWIFSSLHAFLRVYGGVEEILLRLRSWQVDKGQLSSYLFAMAGNNLLAASSLQATWEFLEKVVSPTMWDLYRAVMFSSCHHRNAANPFTLVQESLDQWTYLSELLTAEEK